MAQFDLPGVDPDSIDLTVERNVLTVTASRSASREEGAQYLVSERPSGRYSRRLLLGENLDAELIEAGYDRGVLTLTIPVTEKAKPRKVPVGTGAPLPPVVDAAA